MWSKIAHFIIKYRLILIVVLGVITAFMGFVGRKVETTFKFAELVPKSHQDFKDFKNFKSTFGEDANAFAIGFAGKEFYELENFKIYHKLLHDISAIEGIDTVVGLSNVPQLSVLKKKKRYELKPIFKDFPETQEQLDFYISEVKKLKVYENQLYDVKTGDNLMLVSLEEAYLNSKHRQTIIFEIERLTTVACESMSGDVEAHFAGIPYVRAALAGKVQKELKLFLYHHYLKQQKIKDF